MFRKHQFASTGHRPMPDLAPRWIEYVCIYCWKASGLEAWQMREMPVQMARCPSSEVRAGFLEWLTSTFNCYVEEKESPRLINKGHPEG